MDYNDLKAEYDKFLKAKADEHSLSVEEYMDMLINNSALDKHTLQVADIIKGYIEAGELNLKLSEEGIIDIGDTTW